MGECLNCLHWQRNSYDGVVGLCAQLNELRFQHEENNMFCTFEFVEGREACRDHFHYKPIEETREQPAIPFDEKPMPYYRVKDIERKYGKR